MTPRHSLRPRTAPFRSIAILAAMGALALLAGRVQPAQAQPCSGCGLGGRTIDTYPMDGLPPRHTLGYPLIQICPEGVGPNLLASRDAAGSPPSLRSGPDCLFSGLYIKVQAHASPTTRIDSIKIANYPAGTTIQPTPIPFPDYQCPLQFRVYLPPIVVTCGGPIVYHAVTLTAYRGDCNGNYAGRAWVRGGYWLKCVKQGQAADVLRGEPAWVPVPFVNPDTAHVVFAVRNLDILNPHDINLLTTFDQPWIYVTPPPTQITLGPSEQTHILIDVVIPPGTPEGALGNLSLTASYADGPSPFLSDVAQIHVGNDPTPEPPNPIDINDLAAPVPMTSPGALPLWAIATGVFALVVMRRRRAGSNVSHS